MVRWPWRRQPDPLGVGVWRRSHDRTLRAIDRYHQMIEPVDDGPLRSALELVGADLAVLLDQVHEICVQAEIDAPSAGLEIPPGPLGQHPELHRRLSRAATSCAEASEAAAMARVASAAGDQATALARMQAARRAAALARVHVA